MHKCLFEPVADVFDNYFYTNRDIHGRETRNANALYVLNGRLVIRRSSIKIHGSDLWNALPPYVQNSDSCNVIKIRLVNYLINRNMSMWYKKSTGACLDVVIYDDYIFQRVINFIQIKSESLVEYMSLLPQVLAKFPWGNRLLIESMMNLEFLVEYLFFLHLPFHGPWYRGVTPVLMALCTPGPSVGHNLCYCGQIQLQIRKPAWPLWTGHCAYRYHV